MKNIQNKQYKSGLLIIITIILLAGLFFTIRANFISKNIATKRNGYWCQMAKNNWSSCGIPSITNKITTTSTTEESSAEELLKYETIEIWHDQFAMIPDTITLQASKSYKLIITPSANGGGCMSTLTIPGIDENIYKIKKNVPIIITIDNAKPGKYDVVCGAMGMYQGQIIVK